MKIEIDVRLTGPQLALLRIAALNGYVTAEGNRRAVISRLCSKGLLLHEGATMQAPIHGSLAWEWRVNRPRFRLTNVGRQVLLQRKV